MSVAGKENQGKVLAKLEEAGLGYWEDGEWKLALTARDLGLSKEEKSSDSKLVQICWQILSSLYKSLSFTK